MYQEYVLLVPKYFTEEINYNLHIIINSKMETTFTQTVIINQKVLKYAHHLLLKTQEV